MQQFLLLKLSAKVYLLQKLGVRLYTNNINRGKRKSRHGNRGGTDGNGGGSSGGSGDDEGGRKGRLPKDEFLKRKDEKTKEVINKPQNVTATATMAGHTKLHHRDLISEHAPQTP